MKYLFGIMSSKYSLEAENHLLAISAICHFYSRGYGQVVVYEPKDCPSWVGFDGKAMDRLDEIFKEHGGFEEYAMKNTNAIKNIMETIKKGEK